MNNSRFHFVPVVGVEADQQYWCERLKKLRAAQSQAEKDLKQRAWLDLSTIKDIERGLTASLHGYPPLAWRPRQDPENSLRLAGPPPDFRPEYFAVQYVLAAKRKIIEDDAHTSRMAQRFGVSKETVQYWVRNWETDNPDGRVPLPMHPKDPAFEDWLERKVKEYSTSRKQGKKRTA